MHLIKINNQYINLDNVTSLSDWGDAIDVLYVGADEAVRLHDAEANALRRYLDRIATDLLSPAQTDSDFQQYLSRGGDMTYADWKVTYDRMMSFHHRSEEWWQNKHNQKLVADLEAELKL